MQPDPGKPQSRDCLSTKSKFIRDFVGALTEHLGVEAYAVVDHWEADRCAIGVASPADLSTLVYVRVYDAAPRYFLSFELAPAGEWSNHPYTPDEEVSTDSLIEVVGLIQRHLARSSTARSGNGC